MDAWTLEKSVLLLQANYQNQIESTMYAIVDIAGRQTKVEGGKFIYTNKLSGNEGDAVEFANVLLTDNAGTVTVGAPFVSDFKVTGKILGHVKGDKVIVFKKKRRKGYKKKNGHRQQFTKVLIDALAF
jgi:large subunit ribosomal protein L21